jgi:hypothetical protein
MGNTIGFLRGLLLLVLLLSLPGVSACVAAGSKDRYFDIPAQPVASALNEFAKQADITLIFSYDLVAGESTHPLKGRFTVDVGLNRLLTGTPLSYRKAADGTYLICVRTSCGPETPARSEKHARVNHQGHVRDSGNPSPARLQVKPAPMPRI